LCDSIAVHPGVDVKEYGEFRKRVFQASDCAESEKPFFSDRMEKLFLFHTDRHFSKRGRFAVQKVLQCVLPILHQTPPTIVPNFVLLLNVLVNVVGRSTVRTGF
jgi:hypothetical protein